MKFIMIYFMLISLILFILMGLDKLFAIKKMWRIPEKTLIAIGYLGGAIGGIVGMTTFRHKTQKIKFWTNFVIALIFNILIMIFWLNQGL